MNTLLQDSRKLVSIKNCLLKKHETKNKTRVMAPSPSLQKAEITYEKLLQKILLWIKMKGKGNVKRSKTQTSHLTQRWPRTVPVSIERDFHRSDTHSKTGSINKWSI